MKYTSLHLYYVLLKTTPASPRHQWVNTSMGQDDQEDAHLLLEGTEWISSRFTAVSAKFTLMTCVCWRFPKQLFIQQFRKPVILWNYQGWPLFKLYYLESAKLYSIKLNLYLDCFDDLATSYNFFIYISISMSLSQNVPSHYLNQYSLKSVRFIWWRYHKEYLNHHS